MKKFLFNSLPGENKWLNSSWPKKMIRSKIAIAILGGILLSTNAMAQGPSGIQPEELKNFEGSWKGSLTYKDYSTGKETSIAATVVCHLAKPENESRTWVMNFDYPGEKGHDHSEEYRINKEGTGISNKLLVEKTLLPDGSLKIILEEKGKDGNDQKPAIFHHIIKLSASTLTITKMVRFEGDQVFIKRNEYQFSKL